MAASHKTHTKEKDEHTILPLHLIIKKTKKRSNEIEGDDQHDHDDHDNAVNVANALFRILYKTQY